ncbi:MAG: nucleoside deaminase [Planctomycetota bacterium]
MILDHEIYMRRAIEIAHGNPDAPFGAVLIDPTDNHAEVAVGLNNSGGDPTLHGEIVCIQNAAAACDCDRLKRCVLYTTAEPCPMCMAACVWSGFAQVVYGTSIPHLQTTGWFQIDLRSHDIAAKSGWGAERVVGGVMADECDALFDDAVRRWGK